MSNTQSLIEQFYEEEKQRLADEASFTPLDLSIDASDMAVLTTIARRFGKDKLMFAREALSQALVDMFSVLDPAERKMLAKEADELANSIAGEMAEEQGLGSIDVTGKNWVNQDKACVKAERKAEKEKKDMEAKLKQFDLKEAISSEQKESTPEKTDNTISKETPAPTKNSEIVNSNEDMTENESMPSSIFGTN